MKKISGNKLLVKALKEEGVDILFGYPGACTIDISDEIYKQDYTKVVLPRHEQALVHAADAYARSTGKVGVCLVTSGPGATNLVTGIATANYDSVPLVCFTGQVARHLIGNDAFQEVDIVGITRSITKYGVTVRKREDLGRIIKEAFYIARSGRPGPVLVDLPKDVMAELGSPNYPETVNIRGYKPSTGVHIGQLKRAVKMLGKAKKPLFLAGGGVNIAGANKAFTELVERTQIPVVTTIMGRGAIPTTHPLFIGNLGMHGAYASNMAVEECDLLFSIGTRFNDRITGKLHAFAPKATIVHIDIDTSSISRNIQVDIPIVADAKEAIEKLLEYVEPMEKKESWMEQIEGWKEEHPLRMKPKGDQMQAQDILETINEVFKEDDKIVVTDVGQHQMFTSQYLEVNEKTRLYMSGGLGTMGYGFPGAVGAQIGNPDSTVIAISGDGGMQMNIQEFATAVLEELPLILCVFNNTYLGMVRQWQKLFYGKRYSMTDLRAGAATRRGEEHPPKYTPDFVKLAESYGAKGIRVTEKSEMKAAFEQAKANRALKVPTLIEFMLDPEVQVYPMVRPGGTLEDLLMDKWRGEVKMDNTMKKRWISLYVENQVGVLSKISGLFSGKSYNLESLTVGRTEDPTISRMTIETNSDEETYEQIKKQLNRMVEVIRVIDFTEVSVVMQELMFIKVKNCTPEDKTELFQIAQTYQAKVRDYGKDSVLLEFVHTAHKNTAIIQFLRS